LKPTDPLVKCLQRFHPGQRETLANLRRAGDRLLEGDPEQRGMNQRPRPKSRHSRRDQVRGRILGPGQRRDLRREQRESAPTLADDQGVLGTQAGVDGPRRGPQFVGDPAHGQRSR